MRYIVIAIRPNQYMRMGWDTEWEQLACAHRYMRQGWNVRLECVTIGSGKTHRQLES